MRRLGIVPSGGACERSQLPVFDDIARTAEAIAICQDDCPVVMQCSQNVGMIALSIPDQNEGVIAGDYHRWRTETQRLIGTNIPRLDDDPTIALSMLREVITQYGSALSRVRPNERETYERIKASYIARDAHGYVSALDPTILDKTWQRLVANVRTYRQMTNEVHKTYTEEEHLFGMADALIVDVMRFGAMKYNAGAAISLALHQTPDAITSLYDEYEMKLDASPFQFRQIVTHNPGDPRHALEDYFLRLDIMRKQFGGILSDSLIRSACAQSETNACPRLLKKWQKTYETLREAPAYQNYEPWLLQKTVALSENARMKWLNAWQGFFRTIVRTASYDGWKIDNIDELGVARATFDGSPGTELQHWTHNRQMSELLEGLSPAERSAVLAVYSLPELPGEDPLDESTLCDVFGVTDIAAYVETVIMPKLRIAS